MILTSRARAGLIRGCFALNTCECHARQAYLCIAIPSVFTLSYQPRCYRKISFNSLRTKSALLSSNLFSGSRNDKLLKYFPFYPHGQLCPWGGTDQSNAPIWVTVKLLLWEMDRWGIGNERAGQRKLGNNWTAVACHRKKPVTSIYSAAGLHFCCISKSIMSFLVCKKGGLKLRWGDFVFSCHKQVEVSLSCSITTMRLLTHFIALRAVYRSRASRLPAFKSLRVRWTLSALFYLCMWQGFPRAPVTLTNISSRTAMPWHCTLLLAVCTHGKKV